MLISNSSRTAVNALAPFARARYQVSVLPFLILELEFCNKSGKIISGGWKHPARQLQFVWFIEQSKWILLCFLLLQLSGEFAFQKWRPMK
jgi:hypothetical protein